MKRFAATLVALAGASLAQAQPLTSAFTYQGMLQDAGGPANGVYDLRFRVFDAAVGGSTLGIAPRCFDNVTVVNGQVTLQLDFGGVFAGEQRFLEVEVRPDTGATCQNSAGFTVLSPRQNMTAAPYALYALSGPGSGGPWSVSGNNVFNTNTGNVGVGTNTPTHPLHLRASIPILNVQDSDSTGAAQSGYVRFADNANAERGFVGFGSQTDTHFMMRNLYADGAAMIATSSGVHLTVAADGRVGIGTTAPAAKLDVRGGAILVENTGHQADLLWLATERSWVFRQEGTGAAAALALQSMGGGGNKNFLIDTAGFVGIGTLNPQAKLDVNGTTRTQVLEITGADLAEKFPASEALEPGMVAAIDPTNPGKLCVARGEYNRCVAGVVSGANNFAAGAILGNLPGHEDAPAVALSGRVYVWCDASLGAIEPGDLLTTSGTAGHAMKASDQGRSHGAVIGKAMERLESGRGLVLVLVNLQ
jgi:hypothetical protein